MTQSIAKAKNLRISPQKLRLVADKIRGQGILNATDWLKFSTKKAATLVEKTLKSAIANAEQKNLDIDDMCVAEIYVDKGMVLKRMRPRARGRGAKILKLSSHLTIILAHLDQMNKNLKKRSGT
ncbi:50S ribosomal protein L22 [Gammaproteobacteria bacterium]|jgi:large subunit ribosomal protein L22|nr:50S ribosomal protein L22 [Gammaproteobacteria bacterium]